MLSFKSKDSLLPYFCLEVKRLYSESFVDDAKVMPKGQVTIPKKVRNALGVDSGDRVTFILHFPPALI